MKPPIIIDDHGDLSIFEAVADAKKQKKYVEPIDVSSDDLVAYDSEGRLLRGKIVKRGFLGRGVIFELVENEPKHAGELRERLISFLAQLGEPQQSVEADTLEGLIARGLRLLTP